MRKFFLLMFLLAACFITTFAQDSASKTKLGLYGSIGASYSTYESLPAYWLNIKGGLVFNKKFVVGVGASTLYFDRNLSRLVNDGTYHVEAAYSGLFLEYLFKCTNKTKISISWLSGVGILQYRYDKEYRDSKEWYQEIIDRDSFVANDLSAEFLFRISPKWWVGANISGRLSSPVKIKSTDEFVLRRMSGGVVFRYELF